MRTQLLFLLALLAGAAMPTMAQGNCQPISVNLITPSPFTALSPGELSRDVVFTTGVSATGCASGEITVTYSLGPQVIGTSTDEINNFPLVQQLVPGVYFLTISASTPGGPTASADVTLAVISPDDNDTNGIPDLPFVTLPDDGDTWGAIVPGVTSFRAVGAKRIDGFCVKDKQLFDELTVPNPNVAGQEVTVRVPEAALECGESAILLVSIAGSLDDLLAPEDASELTADAPVADLVAGGSFIEISLLLSDDGGASFSEPAFILPPVQFSLNGLTPNLGAQREYGFLRHPTQVVEDPTEGILITAEPGTWSSTGVTLIGFGGDTYTGQTSILSAFFPFDRGSAADLAVTPTSISFADVPVGGTDSQVVTISSIGSQNVSGNATIGSGAPYSLTGDTAYNIASGSDTGVTVTFSPTAAGTFSTSLRITGDDDGDIFVPITGEAVNAAEGAPDGEGEGEGVVDPGGPPRLIAQVRSAGNGEILRRAILRIAPVNGIVGNPPDNQLNWILRSRRTTNPFDVLLPDSPFYRVATTAPGHNTDFELFDIDGTLTTNIALAVNAAVVDTDGDGIIDTDEINIFGSDSIKIDTDLDGMSDLFELEYDFPVANGASGTPVSNDGDFDFDLLSNLQESIIGSNPRDINSPGRTVYVAAGATGGDGSRDKPYGSVQDAFDAIDADPAKAEFAAALKGVDIVVAPATVILRNGTYVGDVALRANTRLTGESRSGVILVGRVASAPNASIVNLTLQEPAGAPLGANALLTIDDTGMVVSNVAFLGDDDKQDAVTGILLQGDQRATVISDNLFNGLGTSAEVQGTLPIFRRSVVDGMSETGMLISGAPTEPLGPNRIGDATDPQSGWNQFTNIDGPSFINLRQSEVKIENCFWGTDDVAIAQTLIQGPADITPILRASSGIVPGAITCVVSDAAEGVPVETATVTLVPTTFPPVTNAPDGVYVFAAIPPESYTVRVQAEGYLSQSTTVNVAGGAGPSLLFALRAGDDPVPPAGGCNCQQAKAGEAPPVEAMIGNGIVAALTVLGLLGQARRRRR